MLLVSPGRVQSVRLIRSSEFAIADAAARCVGARVCVCRRFIAYSMIYCPAHIRSEIFRQAAADRLRVHGAAIDVMNVRGPGKRRARLN